MEILAALQLIRQRSLDSISTFSELIQKEYLMTMPSARKPTGSQTESE